MANLDYTASEINSLLRQVNVNRNNIGMNQVNVLPLPDGEIEMNGVNPDADIVTVESDSAQGKITVTVDGTLESSFVLEEYYLTVLSPDGTAGYDDCAKGIILPGIYDATDLLHQFSGDIDSNSTGIQIRVYTSTSGSNYDFDWCRHTFDEFSKVTIPENVVKVEVVLELSIDGTGSVSGSAEFTPMLSLVNWGEPSFEAYKPDLQTQIASKADSSAVTALAAVVATKADSAAVGAQIASLTLRVENLEEHLGEGYNEVQGDALADNAFDNDA